jgi:hypothetical protein
MLSGVLFRDTDGVHNKRVRKTANKYTESLQRPGTKSIHTKIGFVSMYYK